MSGRWKATPPSCMAIALASPGPIQMGRIRSVPTSLRITTGVFDVRSNARLLTLTSINRAPRFRVLSSQLQRLSQVINPVGSLPGEEPHPAPAR